MCPTTAYATVDVRPMSEADLDAAELTMKTAFGTFLGLPDPASFMGDARFIRPRWRADPSAAFAAHDSEGRFVGSNFATNWGSFGFFGPLSIRPDMWDRGVGQRLMEPVLDCFARWHTSHTGLFTFAHSPKHLALYQRFGFWPRYLTAVMSKSVNPSEPASTALTSIRFSEMNAAERDLALAAGRDLTDAVFDGLDLTREIQAVHGQDLGDSLFVWDGSTLAGVAVCHCGPGTEAGSGACYVKFGAVRPGRKDASNFGELLQAVEVFARRRAVSRVIAGVNTARHEAYRAMLARGFRSDLLGVAMHRPNSDGYSRDGLFVMDDWR